MEDEDVDLFEAMRLSKLSKSHLYELMREKLFPLNRKSGKRVYWLRSEILEWKKNRPVYKPRPTVVRGPRTSSRRKAR